MLNVASNAEVQLVRIGKYIIQELDEAKAIKVDASFLFLTLGNVLMKKT